MVSARTFASILSCLLLVSVWGVILQGDGNKKARQTKQTPLDGSAASLHALTLAEADADAYVGETNRFLATHTTLKDASTALKSAGPSGETIDAIVALKPALTVVVGDEMMKWQSDGSGVPGPILQRVVPKLKEHRHKVQIAMNTYEAALKPKKLSDEVQTKFLITMNGLDSAIKLIGKKYSQEERLLYLDARVHAKDIVERLGAIYGKADSEIADATQDAVSASQRGGPGFKVFLGTAQRLLTFAARAKEGSDALDAKLIDALKTVGLSRRPPTLLSDLPSAAKKLILACVNAAEGYQGSYHREVVAASDALEQLRDDFRRERIEARVEADRIKAKAEKDAECQAAMQNLADKLKEKPINGLVGNDKLLKEAVDRLLRLATDNNRSVSTLSVLATSLLENYGDNISAWTETEINLYYFDDVERLLTMITPNITTLRGGENLMAGYQTSQADLLRSQEALVNARAKVNDVRRALFNAQEELRVEQVRAEREKAKLRQELAAAGGVVDVQNEEEIKAKLEFDHAEADLTAANQAVTDMKERIEAEEETGAKTMMRKELAALQEKAIQAKRERDQKEAAWNAVKARSVLAGNKQTDAKTRLGELQDKVATLEGRLTTAQNDETTQTDNFRTASTNAYISAFLANRKFAEAVDRTPFFITRREDFAQKLKDSTDPADRVLLYGEPMEKRIVIRGRASDVETVRRLIALLDRPQAQSEITVYSAEISSVTDEAKMAKAREAMRVLDVELARYSLYNDAAQLLLRQAISAVTQAQPYDASELRKRLNDTLDRPSEVHSSMLDEALDWLGRNDVRLRQAFVCIDTRVLKSLGVEGAIKGVNPDYFRELPDITSPASLAEATLTLALLRPDLREQALNIFYNEIDGRFESVVPRSALSAYENLGLKHPDTFRPKSYLKVFEELSFNPNRAMSVYRGWDSKAIVDARAKEAGGKPSSSTSSNPPTNLPSIKLNDPAQVRMNDADVNLLQDGFIYIYRARNQPVILERLLNVRTASVMARVELMRKKQLRLGLPTLQGIELSISEQNPLKEHRKRMIEEFQSVARQLHHPVDPEVISRLNRVEDYDEFLKALSKTLTRFREETISYVYGGFDYHRNIARYNMALRRVMTRYYTDVQNLLVNGDRGLIVNVDRILKSSDSEVGAWSSQTILASNRLAARMDPQASASAQQSNPIDALGGSLVLANLISSGASQNIPGMIKGLKELQGSTKESMPAIYGVGTGNVFEVTPIVDPTGQAMRFRFNYVASTRVREPGGISDRTLNQVERNSINTEVVLDNLAIRRVSTFQSNVSLGLPSQKSGGLPIFKDLPVLKEIPLIGWFTYRIGGRKPVVQQSVVLTQAAIYPTIEDVVGSLSISFR